MLCLFSNVLNTKDEGRCCGARTRRPSLRRRQKLATSNHLQFHSTVGGIVVEVTTKSALEFLSGTRAILAAMVAALAIMTASTIPSFAQYGPTTPGVSPGGQAMFRSVTDFQLLDTLSMGEYLLIVCKQVPLPRMTAQVVFLREEAIMRLGPYATEGVVLAVEQLLAQNPNPNTAMCVDSPGVDF